MTFCVENTKTNTPVVRIAGDKGFQTLKHWVVKDENGNVILETKEFTHNVNSTYFGRESSKKDSQLLGYCEIAEGRRPSGYAKNRDLGNGWFEMSAYAYKVLTDGTIVRTTIDKGAAYGREDNATPVAKISGNTIAIYKKIAQTKKTAPRTDKGGTHKKDSSARGALEKARRA